MPAGECPWAITWELIGTNLSAGGSRHRVQSLVSVNIVIGLADLFEEKRSPFSSSFYAIAAVPFVIPRYAGDLRCNGPVLEMFFDRSLLAPQLQLPIDSWELNRLRRLQKQSMTPEVAREMHVQEGRSRSLVA
jgi:hypothetical protein